MVNKGVMQLQNLKIVYNTQCGKNKPALLQQFQKETAQEVMQFHKTFDAYAMTHLAQLHETAQLFGIQALYVKDESSRFGLNAFKGLGGSYCLGKYIATLLKQDIHKLSCATIASNATKEKTGELTFVTATDGNHGRGIAWTAATLGHKAVVYMPKGSALERLENIRKLGATAEMTTLNYDDTVRFAQKQAQENGWVLVQDTAWPGYETIPTYIMQGYLTMAAEAVQQLGNKVPTHIFLQAGVGAMSGALTAFFRNVYGFTPCIVIVEPDKADCIYKTAYANDGQLHTVSGDMDTIMAGLACGEPCTLGWDLLSYGADAFISMSDDIAAMGMRVLGNPYGSDDRVISGESGAATFGAVLEILKHQPSVQEKLNLTEDAVVLCFSTEGATDLENYQNIVWNGLYQNK